MKYSIEHVLAGIKASRVEQVEAAMAKRAELYDAQLARLARVAAAPGEVAALLVELAVKVSEMPQANHGDFSDWGRGWGKEISAYTHKLPSLYDVSRGQQEIDKQAQRIDSLMRMDDGDTKLETFLKALAEGGETHVTQNALKTAGFKEPNVAEYIMARARAQAAVTKE